MNSEHEISNELLNAFVDDELDAAEKSRLLEQLAESPGLRARVCELWQLKEMVRSGHPLTAAPTKSGRPGTKPGMSRFTQLLAACLVLAVGAGAGWSVREAREPARSIGFELGAERVDEGKIILHLASSDSDRLKTALDEAEELAASRDRDGNPVRVELITNAGGLDLLRKDASPYPKRIGALHRAYANLSFLACRTAMDNLIRKGVHVELLPEAEVTDSAVDRIVKRLKQGWVYIQV